MSFTEGIFWTHIHGLIAVVCANLPVYKPIRAKAANFFTVVQRRFGSSFRSLRDDSNPRINSSSTERLELDFHMKPIPSDPSLNSHKQPDELSKESTYPILNNPGGTNLSMANRGDASMAPHTIPPHGIMLTRDVDVF